MCRKADEMKSEMGYRIGAGVYVAVGHEQNDKSSLAVLPTFRRFFLHHTIHLANIAIKVSILMPRIYSMNCNLRSLHCIANHKSAVMRCTLSVD